MDKTQKLRLKYSETSGPVGSGLGRERDRPEGGRPSSRVGPAGGRVAWGAPLTSTPPWALPRRTPSWSRPCRGLLAPPWAWPALRLWAERGERLIQGHSGRPVEARASAFRHVPVTADGPGLGWGPLRQQHWEGRGLEGDHVRPPDEPGPRSAQLYSGPVHSSGPG